MVFYFYFIPGLHRSNIQNQCWWNHHQNVNMLHFQTHHSHNCLNQRRINSDILVPALFPVRIATARSCCHSSTATFNFQLLDKTSWLNLVHVTSFSFIQKCNCVYIRKNHVRVCCLLNCLALNCFEVNLSFSSCLSSVFLRFSLVHCSPVAAMTKTAANFVLLLERCAPSTVPLKATVRLIARLEPRARPSRMTIRRVKVWWTGALVRDNLIKAHVICIRLQRHNTTFCFFELDFGLMYLFWSYVDDLTAY